MSHFLLYKSGELHHQALQCGSWKKMTLTDIEKQYGNQKNNFAPTPYINGTKYKKHRIVEYGGMYYESLEGNNSCKPGELLPALLYVFLIRNDQNRHFLKDHIKQQQHYN